MNPAIQEKLTKLLGLQVIDSRLDQLNQIKGDLPQEVADIEDEIAKYTTRKTQLQESIKEIKGLIANRKLQTKDAKKSIETYEAQQMKVRNNREYDAITKEINYQDVMIKLNRKKNSEDTKKIEEKERAVAEVDVSIEEQEGKLKSKQEELAVVLAETEQEEAKILEERTQYIQTIEDRILNYYEKLRKTNANKLAIVIVKHNACGGCFSAVPPQRQLEIKQKNQMISCESCGRILADVEIEPEKEKPSRRDRRSKLAAAKST